MENSTNNKIMSIIAPFDFTENSANSLQTAINVCKRHKTSLHVVHAQESNYVAFPGGDGMSSLGNTSSFDSNKAIKFHLNKLKSYISKKHKLKVFVHIKKGSVSDVICSVAQKVNASLIVMGTHGASGLKEFFIGSNAYKVIKNASVPVITVPVSFKNENFENILFPVRIVEGALEKYECIRQIVFKNNSIIDVVGLLDEEKPLDHALITKVIEVLKLKFKNDNVYSFSANYKCTNIAETILNLSSDKKPDLLVINASLDYGLNDIFKGSFTQQIVNHAKVPVLSFKNDFKRTDIEQSNVLVAEWAIKYSSADPLSPAYI